MVPDHQRERHYWAFAADPRRYRVEARVAETDTGIWRVQNSDVRVGDRGVIWKYDGGEGWRGVVALAEVLSDPEIAAARTDPYWRETERAAKLEPRVKLRTVRAPNLPLRLPHPALDGISAARGSQRSIFKLTSEEWVALVKAACGWLYDLAAEAEDAAAERRTSSSTRRRKASSS